MGRAARFPSLTSIYHIVDRGVERREIFIDDLDRQFYLKQLARIFQKYEVKLLGYCLMTNHVHLLVMDTGGNKSKAMHDLSGLYAQYFNDKYKRAGHLHQGRFKDKAIDGESYALSALRYIHDNPQKAGICNADQYPWSSYREYASTPIITDTSILLPILGGSEAFKAYSQGTDNFIHLEVEMSKEEALRIFNECMGEETALPKSERNKRIQEAFQKGLSCKQLATFTFLSEQTIRRIVRPLKIMSESAWH